MHEAYVYAVLYGTNPSNVHLRHKHTLSPNAQVQALRDLSVVSA